MGAKWFLFFIRDANEKWPMVVALTGERMRQIPDDNWELFLPRAGAQTSVRGPAFELILENYELLHDDPLRDAWFWV